MGKRTQHVSTTTFFRIAAVKKRERERDRQIGRKEGRKGARKDGRKGGREGGRKGARKEGRKEGRERGKEGGREKNSAVSMVPDELKMTKPSLHGSFCCSVFKIKF